MASVNKYLKAQMFVGMRFKIHFNGDEDPEKEVDPAYI